MKKSEYFSKSLINALGVLVYVSIVAFLIFNGEHIFDNKPSFLIPLFMLLLFIISASVTGLLVMGKPIHLYLSGFKKESFILLFTTLAWLALFIVVIITGLLLL